MRCKLKKELELDNVFVNLALSILLSLLVKPYNMQLKCILEL